jgi:hypothetical protein
VFEKLKPALQLEVHWQDLESEIVLRSTSYRLCVISGTVGLGDAIAVWMSGVEPENQKEFLSFHSLRDKV